MALDRESAHSARRIVIEWQSLEERWLKTGGIVGANHCHNKVETPSQSWEKSFARDDVRERPVFVVAIMFAITCAERCRSPVISSDV
jgi:hypothetical protein